MRTPTKHLKFNVSFKGFPVITVPDTQKKIKYTRHAQEQARSKYYAPISLPETINLNDVKIFECELDAKTRELVKIVIRFKIGLAVDLVMPLLIDDNYKLIATTVWINKHNDKHATINPDNYTNGHVK